MVEDSQFAPRRISDVVHNMRLRGYVIAFLDGHPVLNTMPGTADLFLLVFSTKDKLTEIMDAYCVDYDSIKQIDDQLEFVKLIMNSGIRIAVDVVRMGDRIRFKEVIVR
jgi:hypothetical protein